jgi:hypothetical protein
MQVPQSGALVLRISGTSLTRAGFISPPQSSGYDGSSIERSLVIGQTLWTISPGGVLASDLRTLRKQAWLPFSQTVNSYPSPSASAIVP